MVEATVDWGKWAAKFAILAGVASATFFVHDYFAKTREIVMLRSEIVNMKCLLKNEIDHAAAQIWVLTAQASATQANADIERAKLLAPIDQHYINQRTIERDAHAEEFKEAISEERRLRNASC